MRAGWKRKLFKASAGLLLFTAIASKGFAQHQAIKLLDFDGNNIKDTLNATKTLSITRNDNTTQTVMLGNPVSFERTCGQCHEEIIDDVRMSHHGAIGLHDMGWMDGETKGDDTGTKDFVTNKVLRMRYFRSKSHYGGW